MDWLGPKHFCVLLLVLIVAAFPDVVFGGGTFFYRDFGIFGYPLAFHHRESFWQGEIPLWNPYNSAGIPFLAQWNTLVCYPLSLIYLLLPLPWSLGIYCLIHLFLAGLGMYLLAFAWTQSRFGACIAGISFAFGGLALSCLKWPNNIAALGWMPWVVLLVESGVCIGGRRLATACLLAGIQMLSGAPEIILFTWGILIALVARLLWIRGRQRCADDSAASSSAWIVSRRFVGVAGAVAGLAAVQLLPFLDLLWHSHRDAGFADSSWSMPLWGWANFLVPLFRCFPSYQGVFAQVGQYWVSSYYCGVGVILLSGIAAWRFRNPRVRLLILLTVFSLVLSFGSAGVVYDWVAGIFPPIRIVRFPIKFVVVAVFTLPILAAFGAGTVSRRLTGGGQNADEAQGFSHGAIPIVCVSAGLLALIGAITWYGGAYPLPTDQWSAIWRSAAGRAAFLGLIAVALLGTWRLSLIRHLRIATILVLSVVWLDLFSHAPRLNPTVEPWALEKDLARNELKLDPGPRAGGSRAMLTPYADYRLNHVTFTNAVDDYLFSRMSLFANANLLDSIPKVDGFFSLYTQPQNQIRSLLYSFTNASYPKIEAFLGVSHVTSENSLIEWAPRTNFLPLVTGGQQPVFADLTNTIRQITDPGFDSSQVVLLPEAAALETSVSEAANVKLRLNQFSSHEVRIEIDADRPAWVVVSQTAYHPWKIYLNGRKGRLFRANLAFQAFEVPSGVTEARLVYEDWAFRIGAFISVLTLLTLLWLWTRMKPFPGNDSRG